MDENKLEELRELVDFLKANGIAEFDMERADLKVRIKFAGRRPQRGGSGAGAADACGRGGGNARPAAAGGPAAAAAEPEEKLHEVKSPIVGTFYESPSPGSPAVCEGRATRWKWARCCASSKR